MPRSFAALLTLALLAGCQSSFERYYVPSPEAVMQSFPPVDEQQVQVIESSEQDTVILRDRLYPDATLIGTASFVGPDQTAADLRRFAGSIGSDLVIWSARYLDTVVYTDYDEVDRTDTRTITTKRGDKKTVTQVEDRYTEVVPRTVTHTRYQHEVLYLRR